MNRLWNRVRDFFTREVWETDLAHEPPVKATLIRLVQLIYAMHRELTEGALTLRAMGLVYTSLLSLVPLLAVSFSVLKAFGVHNRIQPTLSHLLQPLGPKGEQITENIIRFVDNVNVGVLGALGLLLLFYTVVSLLQKVEDAFNYIWRTRHSRSFLQRFSEYVSVIVIGPVLVFAALGVTASMASTSLVQSLISIEPFGTIFYFLGQLLPYLLVIAAFTFIYIFIPNTKVTFRAALVGALVSGILWETAGWVFAWFVASSTKYDAIYSGFAILILFMIWVYLSWLILLMGAQIAFYYQRPQYIRIARTVPQLSSRMQEAVGLWIVQKIVERFYTGGAALGRDKLAYELGLPPDPVGNVLRELQYRGLIKETSEDPPGYIPARDPDAVSVYELLAIIRHINEDSLALDPNALASPEVEHIMARVDQTLSTALAGQTVKSLVSLHQATKHDV